MERPFSQRTSICSTRLKGRLVVVEGVGARGGFLLIALPLTLHGCAVTARKPHIHAHLVANLREESLHLD